MDSTDNINFTSELGSLFGFSPNSVESMVQMAQLELATGNAQLAIETLTTLVDIAPFHQRGRLLLAAAYASIGDIEHAEVQAEVALGTSSDDIVGAQK